MTENRTSIRNWVKEYNKGKFLDKNVLIQVEAGWYDWFCKDTSLALKTHRMGQVLKQLKDGGKVNLDETYVWFKNNCPVNHPLYDDFRIANISDGATQLIVQIDSPWEEHKYTVYSVDDFFDKPIFGTNQRRELVKWLNNEVAS